MTTPNLQAGESADIRGQKTRLRPMRPDGAPLFYGWATDPEVQPFWGGHDRCQSLGRTLRDRGLTTATPPTAAAATAPTPSAPSSASSARASHASPTGLTGAG